MMNKKIFSCLWLLLVITITSVTFAVPINYANCETIFKTTECTTCQKSLYEFGYKPAISEVKSSQCPTSLILHTIISKEYKNAGYNTTQIYDLVPYKKALDKYCGQEYHCDQKEVDETLEKIKKSCVNELTVPLDLSADPRTVDFNVLITYEVLFFYYSGIPSHKAICLKNGKSGFCSYELHKKLVEYIKKESGEDPNIVLTLDESTLILSNGTKKSVPQDLFCIECWKKVANIYFNHFTKHRLDDQLEQNIFGGYDKMKYYYNYNDRCNNNKRSYHDGIGGVKGSNIIRSFF